MSKAILFLTTLYFAVGSAALAGAPPLAPEVDPSSLGAFASGISGAFIVYRMIRANRKK